MKQYGLIGLTLKHSFSKQYFTEKFMKEKIDARYELYELENIEKYKELISSSDIFGLNVTIPYKEQVMPMLDGIDDEAKRIGAVNTIKFIRENGRMTTRGYNTDVIGFRDSIVPMLAPSHRKALVLGTGGASKSVLFVLRGLGIEPQLVSRHASEGVLSYGQITDDVMKEHTVIVNTTPLGMYPNVDSAPDIPYQYLGPHHVAYDLVYNPIETLFCKKCKEKGAAVQSGLAMLYGQAEASWRIWNM